MKDKTKKIAFTSIYSMRFFGKSESLLSLIFPDLDFVITPTFGLTDFRLADKKKNPLARNPLAYHCNLLSFRMVKSFPKSLSMGCSG